MTGETDPIHKNTLDICAKKLKEAKLTKAEKEF